MPIDYAVAAAMLNQEVMEEKPVISPAYEVGASPSLPSALLEPTSNLNVMNRPVILSVNGAFSDADSKQMHAYRAECQNLKKAFPGYPQPAVVTVQFNVPF